jgi:cyclophilin family peptidyl-prolyl cis-trans isomerase
MQMPAMTIRTARPSTDFAARHVLRASFTAVVGAIALLVGGPAIGAATPPSPLSATDVLKESAPSDWRPVDPENTLYLELASGRVVMELAPAFAPKHVANLKALVREKYFDGLSIVRAVEWEDSEGKRTIKSAATTLPSEFFGYVRADQPFVRLPDGDLYAPEVGFSGGFPVARDPKSRTRWLTHCYGMLGLGRDNDPTSGFGGSPFVVIGQTRNLDRNDTLVGHVVHGIDLLSTLPRGTGPLGFYEKREQNIPIRSMRVAADVPPAERTEVEVLRTDTPTFLAYVQARRSPPLGWYVQPAGHVDVCTVRVAARLRPGTPAAGTR